VQGVYEASIDGDLPAVYRLVTELESWPDLFPHVTSVDVLWRGGESVVARVRASRSGIPLTWTCRLDTDQAAARVLVQHVDGFARGLRATWTFDPLPARRKRARLAIDYHTHWPSRDRWLARRVLADLATRTVSMVVLLAEADRATHQRRDAGHGPPGTCDGRPS